MIIIDVLFWLEIMSTGPSSLEINKLSRYHSDRCSMFCYTLTKVITKLCDLWCHLWWNCDMRKWYFWMVISSSKQWKLGLLGLRCPRSRTEWAIIHNTESNKVITGEHSPFLSEQKFNFWAIVELMDTSFEII